MEEPTVGEVEQEEGSSVLLVKASKELVDTEGNKFKAEAEVSWDPGEDLDEAIAKYGAEIVYDMYIRASKIKLQSQMRSDLETGADQEAITATFADWRPDIDRTPTRDPKATIVANFNKLDAEEREALIAQLREGLGI